MPSERVRRGGGGGDDARHRKLKEVASDDAEVPSSRMQGDVDSPLLAFACLHTLPSPVPYPFHLRLFRFPFIARRFFLLCLFSSRLGDAAGFHLCFAAFSCYSSPLSFFFPFLSSSPPRAHRGFQFLPFISLLFQLVCRHAGYVRSHSTRFYRLR